MSTPDRATIDAALTLLGWRHVTRISHGYWVSVENFIATNDFWALYAPEADGRYHETPPGHWELIYAAAPRKSLIVGPNPLELLRIAGLIG